MGLVGKEDGKGPKRRKDMETSSGGLFGASSVWHKIPGVGHGLAGIIILFCFMPPVSCTSKGHRKKKKNDTQNINVQVSDPDANFPLKRNEEKDHRSVTQSTHLFPARGAGSLWG